MRAAWRVGLAVVVLGCSSRRVGPGFDAGMDAVVVSCAMGAETSAALCANACDDDRDGLADCDDGDCCALVSCAPGTACNPLDAGPSDAGAPGCDAGCSEVGAATCANGIDDDCDGFADCDDFSCCSSVTCGPDTGCGRRPDSGPRDAGTVPACDGAITTEDTVEACSDGCSNDGDAFADCQDRDCCAFRTDCGPSTFCGRPPACVPPCEAGPEDAPSACNDGCSNDGDTFVDCEDRDCCPVRSDCGPTTYCGRTSFDAGPCTPGAESDLAACTDGCSNDGDTFVDCEDRDCCPVLTDCGPTTYCGRM